MTAEELRKARVPPPIGPAVQALWWAARGDWNRAHERAQVSDGKDSDWVHAYLHRVEGDLENARYLVCAGWAAGGDREFGRGVAGDRGSGPTSVDVGAASLRHDQCRGARRSASHQLSSALVDYGALIHPTKWLGLMRIGVSRGGCVGGAARVGASSEHAGRRVSADGLDAAGDRHARCWRRPAPPRLRSRLLTRRCASAPAIS